MLVAYFSTCIVAMGYITCLLKNGPLIAVGLVRRLWTLVLSLVNGLGEDVVDIFSRNLHLGTLSIDQVLWRKLWIVAPVKQMKNRGLH